MISANYVFGGNDDQIFSEDYVACEKFLDDSLNEFNIEYIDYVTNVNKLTLESTVMNTELDDETKLLIEAAEKNIIAKLGEKIIEMSNKFIEFIDKKIQEIKDKFFKYKNNEKKLAELVKKHPELGQEKIKILCDEGALDFSDMKSLSEMDKEFMKIVKLAKEGDIDPDSMRGKWNTAKKKWFGDDDKISQIAKITALATGAITLALAIKTFSQKKAESSRKLHEEKLNEQRTKAELLDALQKAGFKENQGRASTILAINRERLGMHQQALGKHLTAMQKFENALANIADKITGKRGIEKMNAEIENNKYVKDMLDKKEFDAAATLQHAKNVGDKLFKDTRDYEKMKKREASVEHAVGKYKEELRKNNT